MRTSPACGPTASRIALPASKLPVERKGLSCGMQNPFHIKRHVSKLRSALFTQLGGLPVPWLPWLPIRAGDGSLQDLE